MKNYALTQVEGMGTAEYIPMLCGLNALEYYIKFISGVGKELWRRSWFDQYLKFPLLRINPGPASTSPSAIFRAWDSPRWTEPDRPSSNYKRLQDQLTFMTESDGPTCAYPPRSHQYPGKRRGYCEGNRED